VAADFQRAGWVVDLGDGACQTCDTAEKGKETAVEIAM